MGLEDGSQNDAQPLQVEIQLCRSTRLIDALSDKFKQTGWKKCAIHDIAIKAGYKACYGNRCNLKCFLALYECILRIL